MIDDKDIESIIELEKMARSKTNGHYTIMKFTTNYKVKLDYQDFSERDDIDNMTTGHTLANAIEQEIKKHEKEKGGER